MSCIPAAPFAAASDTKKRGNRRKAGDRCSDRMLAETSRQPRLPVLIVAHQAEPTPEILLRSASAVIGVSPAIGRHGIGTAQEMKPNLWLYLLYSQLFFANMRRVDDGA
jgi:hypothetical protein